MSGLRQSAYGRSALLPKADVSDAPPVPQKTRKEEVRSEALDLAIRYFKAVSEGNPEVQYTSESVIKVAKKFEEYIKEGKGGER